MKAAFAAEVRLLQKAGSCGLLVCAGGPHWGEVLGAAGLRPAFAAGARLLQKAGSCGLLVCAGGLHRGEVFWERQTCGLHSPRGRASYRKRVRAGCWCVREARIGAKFLRAAGLRPAFAAGARLLQKAGSCGLLVCAGSPHMGRSFRSGRAAACIRRGGASPTESGSCGLLVGAGGPHRSEVFWERQACGLHSPRGRASYRKRVRAGCL